MYSLSKDTIKKELAAIEVTFQRLTLLSTTKLTLADLNGDRTELADLNTHIDRWAAHIENQASLRLAQIPPSTSVSMA